MLMANLWMTQTCRPSSNSSAGSKIPFYSNSGPVTNSNSGPVINSLVPTAFTDRVKNLWVFSDGPTVK